MAWASMWEADLVCMTHVERVISVSAMGLRYSKEKRRPPLVNKAPPQRSEQGHP